MGGGPQQPVINSYLSRTRLSLRASLHYDVWICAMVIFVDPLERWIQREAQSHVYVCPPPQTATEYYNTLDQL